MSLAMIAWASDWQRGNVAECAEVPREVGRLNSPRLSEISGLAASRQNPDILWVHNDGEVNEVFAVFTNGKLAARLQVSVTLDDVEDIAIGPGPEEGVDCLYLGDIGDNDSDRRQIRVIRIAEPTVSASGKKKLTAEHVEQFQLRYPDGPHDAEALMIDPATGDVYIATKENGRTRLFRAAAGDLRDNDFTTLELVAYLNVDKVSAGDMSRDGQRIALRSEDRGWLWTRRPDESVAAAMQRRPTVILTRGRRQGENGESIGFSPDGGSYYTLSEGKDEVIYVFPLSPAADPGR